MTLSYDLREDLREGGILPEQFFPLYILQISVVVKRSCSMPFLRMPLDAYREGGRKKGGRIKDGWHRKPKLGCLSMITSGHSPS